MQKVLRRSLLARNQALKKARKLEHQEFKKEKQNSLRESVVRQRAVNSFIKDERKTRREDWISGPLAPQRNAGAAKGIYGTLNMEASRIPTIPEKQREKYINFTVGDRVCAVRGRNRGRIGEITEVDAGRMTVTVEGFNQIDQEIPSYLRGEGEARRPPYQSSQQPIAMSDVRLVITMTDDEGVGVQKDCILRHVVGGEPIVEQPYGTSTPEHTRYIANGGKEGEDDIIPWPTSRAADYRNEASDTFRLDVEERTFVPTIIGYQPLPDPSIIDELRNAFDVKRSRHREDWVEMKLKEDAMEAWKKKRTLLTPEAAYDETKSKKIGHPSSQANDSEDLMGLIQREQLETMQKKRGRPIEAA